MNECSYMPSLSIAGFQGTCAMLIVDDHPENRQVLRKMLEPLGFDVREAVDGIDALSSALEFPPDVILMDVILPGMTGEEATRRIRRAPELQDVVIIAVSATAFQETRETMLNAGCQDFLPKPVEYDRLLKSLQTHLTLEWQYKHEDEPPAHMDNRPPEAIIPPPSDQIQTLEQCALIGDIMGVRAWVKRARQGDPQYAAFIDRIETWAKALDMKALKQFLSEYIYSERL